MSTKLAQFKIESKKNEDIKYRAVVLNNPLNLEKGHNFNKVIQINFFTNKVKLIRYDNELDLDDVILLPYICLDRYGVELYLGDIVKYTNQIYNEYTNELQWNECELEIRKQPNGKLYFFQSVSDTEERIYEFNDDNLNHVERIGNYYEQWFS